MIKKIGLLIWKAITFVVKTTFRMVFWYIGGFASEPKLEPHLYREKKNVFYADPETEEAPWDDSPIRNGSGPANQDNL